MSCSQVEISSKRFKNSLSICSQLSMDSGSRSIYQSKAFPRRERTNCFTRRSPFVSTLLQVLTKKR
ncbi:hypothetical protein ACB092_06G109000 [Castanea dentata]